MMWIDDEPIEGDPNNPGRTNTSDMFSATTQKQADFPYEGNTTPYAYGVLPLHDAVDQTVGGIGTPGNLLGWSTGILSKLQRWKPLSGLVIMPPNTAQLQASMPYGNVGLDNRSQRLLLGTEMQEAGSLLPSAAQIAASYVRGKRR